MPATAPLPLPPPLLLLLLLLAMAPSPHADLGLPLTDNLPLMPHADHGSPLPYAVDAMTSQMKMPMEMLEEVQHDLMSWKNYIPSEDNPTYLHYVNSRADEDAIEADARGAAFIKLCEKFYRQNSSSPVMLDDNDVCTRPHFTCGSRARRYRTHDGTCNNLRRPGCGRARSALLRMLPPRYADGIYQPRTAKSGKPLPSARKIVTTCFGEKRIDSRKMTLWFMQFGQLVSHDLSFSTVRQSAAGPLQCCTGDGSAPLPPSQRPAACYPIPIPRDDPFYGRHNLRCMEFARAMTVPPDDCVFQPAVPMNGVTAHLDLSPIYDNNDTANMMLREGRGGRLRTSKLHMEEFLPFTPNSPAPCKPRNESDKVCFLAGDVRANQNPLMTATHTLFLREHNRIARVLEHHNPHWDDERLYEETRRIMIACYQHVTYHEMLPIFIGREAYQKYFENYSYDEDLCPGTYTEFATGMYRYIHTLVHGILKVLNQHRKMVDMAVLSDVFNDPKMIMKDFHGLMMGAYTQPCRKGDEHYEKEINNQLFQSNKNKVGLCLSCMDIQRSRDHGMPTYNDLREMCGLPRARDFDDLIDTCSHGSTEDMKKAYEHVEDIDGLVGGSKENHIPGTLLGPTLQCMMVNQMLWTQKSDRFFYLNKKQEYPFTDEQLEEIKKASIARLMCDHVQMKEIQRHPFLQISKWNKLVPCEHIPTVDLSAWKERKYE